MPPGKTLPLAHLPVVEWFNSILVPLCCLSSAGSHIATMRCLGFWVVFIATAVYLLTWLCLGTQLVSSPDDIFTLKTTAIDGNFKKKNAVRKLMIEEDYPGLDPAPSSKASIQPKPIEYRTPLMPYAPAPVSPPPPMFF